MLCLYLIYFLLNFIIITYLLMKLKAMHKNQNMTFELYNWKRLFYKMIVLNSIKVHSDTNRNCEWRKWNSFHT